MEMELSLILAAKSSPEVVSSPLAFKSPYNKSEQIKVDKNSPMLDKEVLKCNSLF